MRPVERLVRWPLHPFLLATYPVLFLYSRNLDEARAGDVVRPLVVCLVGAAVVFALLRIATKDSITAAILTSILAVFIFAYGTAMTPLWGRSFAGYVYGRGIILLPLWTFGFVLLACVAACSRTPHRLLTRFLNTFSVAALAFTGVQALSTALLHYTDRPLHTWADAMSLQEKQLFPHDRVTDPVPTTRPDVYLIVADMYTRSDILAGEFDYDNSWFEDELRKLGFVIPLRSQSNYTFTYASLASMLNLDYLHNYSSLLSITAFDKRLMQTMIEDNLLTSVLKGRGYQFVFYPSEFSCTSRNQNADYTVYGSSINISEFERVLINSSIFRTILGGPESIRRNRLHQFKVLAASGRHEGPKFVLVHIMMPHLPAYFDSTGKPVYWGHDKSAYAFDEYKKYYRDQLHFLNTQILECVSGILKDSRIPPIIVLLGDHGFRHAVLLPDGRISHFPPDKLTGIFTAVLVPPEHRRRVYDSITPVNTIRLALGAILGEQPPLLPDETYVETELSRGYTMTLYKRWPRRMEETRPPDKRPLKREHMLPFQRLR